MGRVTISFDKKTEDNLRKNAATKEMGLAEYLRKLIMLGLKIEAASEKESEEKNEEFSYEELKKLWTNSLAWTLENRLLTRLLMKEVSKKSEAELLATVNSLKEKSETFVAGFVK
jgi:hypothetical protein